MQNSQIPVKFGTPFANAAGSGFTRQVPTPSQQSITPGAASMTDGFPPINFSPVGSGGIPPAGQDFNGLLNQISAWARWQAAGAPVYYDSTFSGNIGGYPAATVLASAETLGALWVSGVDNNTSDPDTGGANWIRVSLIAPSLRVYLTTAGTSNWTAPFTGYYLVKVRGAGGGGAGGGGGATWSSGGGGEGGYSEALLFITSGTVIAVTVGAGGPGAGNTNGAQGTTGGTSVFGSGGGEPSATGGTGGNGGTTSCAGGTGGQGFNGALTLYGAYGGDGNPYTNTVQGGQGGGQGGGRTSTVNNASVNALNPGCGGGSIWYTTGSAQTGGNGAAGSVQIWYS